MALDDNCMAHFAGYGLSRQLRVKVKVNGGLSEQLRKVDIYKDDRDETTRPDEETCPDEEDSPRWMGRVLSCKNRLPQLVVNEMRPDQVLNRSSCHGSANMDKKRC